MCVCAREFNGLTAAAEIINREISVVDQHSGHTSETLRLRSIASPPTHFDLFVFSHHREIDVPSRVPTRIKRTGKNRRIGVLKVDFKRAETRTVFDLFRTREGCIETVNFFS